MPRNISLALSILHNSVHSFANTDSDAFRSHVHLHHFDLLTYRNRAYTHQDISATKPAKMSTPQFSYEQAKAHPAETYAPGPSARLQHVILRKLQKLAIDLKLFAPNGRSARLSRRLLLEALLKKGAVLPAELLDECTLMPESPFEIQF